ncbi:hypothetical protein DM40_2532 [Burkholderia cenocepacia]|nr:hypothetical protein DM40_2532 [Burkholderia cenocepacia]
MPPRSNARDVAVRAAKSREKSYKRAAGNGTNLVGMPNDSKYWQVKYRIDGQGKRMAAWFYPTVTLLAAGRPVIE